jgi:sugar lactone lactonase YvrE
LFTAEPSALRRFDIRARTSVAQPVGMALLDLGINSSTSSTMMDDRRVVVGAGLLSTFASLQMWTSDGVTPLLALDENQNEVRQGLPARVGDDLVSYASYRADGSVHVCVTAVSQPRARCAGVLNQTSKVFYQNGRIVFARNGSLLARPFDLERIAFTGDEEPLADGLAVGAGVMGASSTRIFVSDAGVLAFPVGAGVERLVWQRPDGREEPVVDIGFTTNLALSQDGRRALVTDQGVVQLVDLETGGMARLGPTAGDPIWAPDGRRFAHRTSEGIAVRSVDDARESIVMAGGSTGFPEDWSRDGRWIAAGLREGPFQLALIPVGGGEPVQFLERNGSLTRVDEMHFSPDARWLAFNAQSGDRQEVFVVPLPPTGQRWQVSTAGGMQPRWHPAGRTLYFLDPNGMMMAVDIAGGATFSAGTPRALFDIGFSPSYNFDEYRVAPDGRFLVKKPRAQGALRVIVNWQGLLRQ